MKVRCTLCDGTGLAELSPTLQRTLDLIPAKSWKATSEIYCDLADNSVGQTAVSNRLASLERLHLVESREDGKNKLWRSRRGAERKVILCASK